MYWQEMCTFKYTRILTSVLTNCNSTDRHFSFTTNTKLVSGLYLTKIFHLKGKRKFK